MPQSLSALYVHIVFSTRGRIPAIQDEAFRGDLHSYIGGISSTMGCAPIIVGGVEDHIHILACQSRTITVADWVRDLKTGSTGWVRSQRSQESWPGWQQGYGAFSVDKTRLELIREYISLQPEHHHKVTFKEEFLALLRAHDIEWDDKYVFD